MYLQKVNYAALIDGSDDDDDAPVAAGFDDNEYDELFDNTGIKEASIHQAAMDESNVDLFDSPAKKPVGKRKLGAKPEVVKAPSAKRLKKQAYDKNHNVRNLFFFIYRKHRRRRRRRHSAAMKMTLSMMTTPIQTSVKPCKCSQIT